MHRSSFNIMEEFVKQHLNALQKTTIYDIGSKAVSGKGGTYKRLFVKEKWSYCGVDIEHGENVDHVLDKEYEWDIEDESADVVISGQCLEHVEYPWLSMQEMARILKPQGLMCVIVPSAGREHRHPIDCWRFLPDGMKGLAKYIGVDVIKCENPPQSDGKWKDTLLIARKPLKE